MIARLVGKLAETSADSAIVDVQGVGYLVQASARTLDALGPVGGDITILTELQVREDGWTLFGFESTGEREAFRQLTSVQGVGGRVALAIHSVLDPGELAAAVSSGDKAMVARANGVGPSSPSVSSTSLPESWVRLHWRVPSALPLRAAARQPMPCPPSPILASSLPRQVRPLPQPMKSLAPMQASTR